MIRFTYARVLLLAGLALLAGCSVSGIPGLQGQAKREKALALIVEGNRLTQQGSPLLAMERYDRSAKLYPTAEAFYKMGQIYEAQGKSDPAAAAYNKALELAPDFQEARLSLLALGYKPANYTATPDDLARAKDWSARHATELEPLKIAQATAETTTTAPDLQTQRMEVIDNAADKRMPTLAEVQSVLFAPEPGETEKLPSATQPVYTNENDIILATYPYHYNKAKQLRARQLYDRAADEYKNALLADPKQIDARIELGDMLMGLGRSDAARNQYEKALNDFPNNAIPYYKMGVVYQELKQADRARQLYRQALEKDPKFVKALNNLAVMDMLDKNNDGAAKTLDEAIRIDPNYADAYRNRGIIADMQKNKDLALRCYKRYVELNGQRADQVRQWITDLTNEER